MAMDNIYLLISAVFLMSVCGAEKDCESVISEKDESMKGLVHLMNKTFEGITKLIRAAEGEFDRNRFKDNPIAIPMENALECIESENVEVENLQNDCSGLYKNGHTKSGIFKIWPKFLRNPVDVYCDMETDGGGWTLIQRRGDFTPHVNFFKGWNAYKNGFGNLSTEFWIGNDNIFALTNQQKTTLRVDLEDFDGVKVYATYNTFRIGSELERYILSIGGYHGDAGNSLASQNGKVFATKDKDTEECSVKYRGAWWFNTKLLSHDCHKAHLNGNYYKGYHTTFEDGLNWHAFRGYNYSVKSSEMKIRPITF